MPKEMLHRQCFGRIQRCQWEDDVEDKDDSDWVESMNNNSVMNDDGESDE
jgi:hypothetical protein